MRALAGVPAPRPRGQEDLLGRQPRHPGERGRRCEARCDQGRGQGCQRRGLRAAFGGRCRSYPRGRCPRRDRRRRALQPAHSPWRRRCGRAIGHRCVLPRWGACRSGGPGAWLRVAQAAHQGPIARPDGRDGPPARQPHLRADPHGGGRGQAALAALWEPTVPPATSAQLMTWAAAEIAASRAAAQSEALADAHDALAAANDQIRELERKAVVAAHQSALISWDQQTRIAELQQDLAAEGGENRAHQQRRITQLEEEAESLRARMAQLAMALDAAVEAMHTARALANSLRDF